MTSGTGLFEDKYPEGDEWMPKELLAYEKESLGFYISGHPLDRFAGEIKRFTNATARNCFEKGERAEVILAGVVTSYQERPMKNGSGKYAFMTLEDHTGQVEYIVNSKKVDDYRELLSGDEPLLVTGTVDAPFGDGETVRERLRFLDAKLLSRIRSEKSSLLDIRLNADVIKSGADAGPREAAARPRRPLPHDAAHGDPQAQRDRPRSRRRLQGRRVGRPAGPHRADLRRARRRAR